MSATPVANPSDLQSPPYLKLWLLMTTNPDFVTQLSNPANAAMLQEIADQLGIELEDVQLFVTAASETYEGSIQILQGAFQTLARKAFYTGHICPSDMKYILNM